MKFLLSIILIFSLISSPLLTFFVFSKSVYGDGLFMEQLSASLGDRKADLLIKMTPPIVTTDTISELDEKPTVQFRLTDSNTNQTLKAVTYFITIEKDGKQILADWFFNPDGNLIIQMQPRNQSHVSVSGDLDPILNAYTSRPESPVVASGPIFLEGGLYHFIVRIVTVDYSKTIIPDDQQPVFDGWLSIGASKDKTLNVDGKELPVKVLSYYDEIGNITYDKAPNSINFTMPFNYDPKRISDPKNTVFVHQEVHVPKPTELSAAGGYKGYANGEDVTNVLMVDGNNKTTDVVHYMMTKPIVQQITDDYLKNKSNAANGMMTFSLVPSKNGSMAMGGSAMNDTMMMMPPGAK